MPKFTSPEELERKFVQDVYHDIAPGFRHTRYKAWPYVEQFLQSQPAGSIIADVGKKRIENFCLCTWHFAYVNVVGIVRETATDRSGSN